MTWPCSGTSATWTTRSRARVDELLAPHRSEFRSGEEHWRAVLGRTRARGPGGMSRRLTLEEYVDRVASTSFVGAMTPDRRHDFLDEVRDALSGLRRAARDWFSDGGVRLPGAKHESLERGIKPPAEAVPPSRDRLSNLELFAGSLSSNEGLGHSSRSSPSKARIVSRSDSGTGVAVCVASSTSTSVWWAVTRSRSSSTR